MIEGFMDSLSFKSFCNKQNYYGVQELEEISNKKQKSPLGVPI